MIELGVMDMNEYDVNEYDVNQYEWRWVCRGIRVASWSCLQYVIRAWARNNPNASFGSTPERRDD